MFSKSALQSFGYVAVGAAALMGITRFVIVRRHKVGMGKSFLNIVGGGEDVCRENCINDPLCTGYYVNPGSCNVSRANPATDWVEDDTGVMYVKRLETDPPLKWSSWSDCPKCSDTEIGSTRTCSVSGKCPGISSHKCDSPKCTKATFDKFDFYTFNPNK